MKPSQPLPPLQLPSEAQDVSVQCSGRFPLLGSSSSSHHFNANRVSQATPVRVVTGQPQRVVRVKSGSELAPRMFVGHGSFRQLPTFARKTKLKRCRSNSRLNWVNRSLAWERQGRRADWRSFKARPLGPLCSVANLKLHL